LNSGPNGNIHLTAFAENAPIQFFHHRFDGPPHHSNADIIRNPHHLARASGQILSSFGRVGRQPGEFTYAHFLAVDSKGNIYVAEVATGKRLQKFKMASS
jgi:hypothetical protein